MRPGTHKLAHVITFPPLLTSVLEIKFAIEVVNTPAREMDRCIRRCQSTTCGCRGELIYGGVMAQIEKRVYRLLGPCDLPGLQSSYAMPCPISYCYRGKIYGDTNGRSR